MKTNDYISVHFFLDEDLMKWKLVEN